jgi:hypothetical protein
MSRDCIQRTCTKRPCSEVGNAPATYSAPSWYVPVTLIMQGVNRCRHHHHCDSHHHDHTGSDGGDAPSKFVVAPARHVAPDGAAARAVACRPAQRVACNQARVLVPDGNRLHLSRSVKAAINRARAFMRSTWTCQCAGSVGAAATMPPLLSPKQRTRHGCSCFRS